MLPGAGRRALKPAAAPQLFLPEKRTRTLLPCVLYIPARPAHPYHLADKVKKGGEAHTPSSLIVNAFLGYFPKKGGGGEGAMANKGLNDEGGKRSVAI